MQDQLDEHLLKEQAALHLLQQQLQQEATLLKSSDFDALVVLQNAKFATIEQLREIDSQRTQLMGQESDPLKVYRRADPDGHLARLFADNLALAQDCRSSNLANGITMNRCERHFRQSLQILSGDHQRTDIYNGTGQATDNFSNRSFGQA